MLRARPYGLQSDDEKGTPPVTSTLFTQRVLLRRSLDLKYLEAIEAITAAPSTVVVENDLAAQMRMFFASCPDTAPCYFAMPPLSLD